MYIPNIGTAYEVFGDVHLLSYEVYRVSTFLFCHIFPPATSQALGGGASDLPFVRTLKQTNKKTKRAVFQSYRRVLNKGTVGLQGKFAKPKKNKERSLLVRVLLTEEYHRPPYFRWLESTNESYLIKARSLLFDEALKNHVSHASGMMVPFTVLCPPGPFYATSSHVGDSLGTFLLRVWLVIVTFAC